MLCQLLALTRMLPFLIAICLLIIAMPRFVSLNLTIQPLKKHYNSLALTVEATAAAGETTLPK